MLVRVNKESSRFLAAVEENIKRCEEYEKIYPVTYKCPKCNDKKWFARWEDGYEYGEPCTCQINEWAEQKRKHQEEKRGGN